MALNAGARGASDVGPDVEILGAVGLPQCAHRPRRQAHQLELCGFIEVLERRLVGDGDDHGVAVGVGVAVEHDEGERRAVQDQVVWTVGGRQAGAEQAGRLAGLTFDVCHPPGGPEVFHVHGGF